MRNVKRIVCIVLVVIVCLSALLIGKYFSSQNNQSSQYSFDAEQSDYEKGVDSVNCILENRTEDVLYYAAGFSLERYENNKWIELKEFGTVMFDLAYYKAEPGTKMVIPYGVNAFSSMLDSGKYRIVQHIKINDEVAEIYAAFRVK